MESMIKLLRLAIKLGNAVTMLSEDVMIVTLPNGKTIRIRNHRGDSKYGHYYVVRIKQNSSASWRLTAQVYGLKSLKEVVVQLIQELS